MEYPLISVDWLAANLQNSAVKIIDGSWAMPGQVSAFDGFTKGHIPGAVFFDIDATANLESMLPHMAPSAEFFAERMGLLGISENDQVIIYDQAGLFSAARVWWTFKLMGHRNVWVLNGGLPAWRNSNQKISTDLSKISRQLYRCSDREEIVADANDVKAAIKNVNAEILDARPRDRFLGKVPEPRSGLRRGAMPKAINIPHTCLLDNGFLKSKEALAAIWKEAGLVENRPVITTCGSGITAAVLFLGLTYSGWDKVKVYDGSWVEWGSEDNDLSEFPIA